MEGGGGRSPLFNEGKEGKALEEAGLIEQGILVSLGSVAGGRVLISVAKKRRGPKRKEGGNGGGRAKTPLTLQRAKWKKTFRWGPWRYRAIAQNLRRRRGRLGGEVSSRKRKNQSINSFI